MFFSIFCFLLFSIVLSHSIVNLCTWLVGASCKSSCLVIIIIIIIIIIITDKPCKCHNPVSERNQYRYVQCRLYGGHAYVGKSHKVWCSFWLAADDSLVGLNIRHTDITIYGRRQLILIWFVHKSVSDNVFASCE